MDELDERLRRTLGDPPTVRVPNGLPERILAGARRRRRRRMTATVFLSTASVAVLATGSALAATMSAGPNSHAPRPVSPATAVVPWVDRPAGPPAPPSPPLPPPVLYAPCSASQLRAGAGQTGAALGSEGTKIELTNASSSPCTLSGYPTSLIGIAPDGFQRNLHPGHGTMFDSMTAWPANLKPGQDGQVIIASSEACSAAVQRAPSSGPFDPDIAVVLGLPGGGTIKTPASFDALCPVGVTTFGLPELSASEEPESFPYPGLSVALHAPTTAVAGTLLRYQVVLTNTTDHPVPLEPCPLYTEHVDLPDVQASPTYRLNCDTVTAIPERGSVTYAMQVQVPDGVGQAKFGWEIPNSHISLYQPLTVTSPAATTPAAAVSTFTSCPFSPRPASSGPDTSDSAIGSMFRGDPTSTVTIVTDTAEYKAIAGRPRAAGSTSYGNAVIAIFSLWLDPCQHSGSEYSSGPPVTGSAVPGNPADAVITARHGTDITVTGSDGTRHVFDVPAGKWLS